MSSATFVQLYVVQCKPGVWYVLLFSPSSRSDREVATVPNLIHFIHALWVMRKEELRIIHSKGTLNHVAA